MQLGNIRLDPGSIDLAGHVDKEPLADAWFYRLPTYEDAFRKLLDLLPA